MNLDKNFYEYKKEIKDKKKNSTKKKINYNKK